MSVLAEGFSVIVRVSTIETTLEGGIETYVKLVPNRTFCSDQYLTRVGFLDLPTANDFLERLRAVGFTHQNIDEGPDVAVLHQGEGLLSVAFWLEWNRDDAGLSIAWLAGTQPGAVATPAGWSPNSALRYIDNTEAGSRLTPLESAPNYTAFRDSQSGEVVYGLKPAPIAPDPLAHMQIIQRVTAELRIIRDQVAMIYVYYFPKSWFRVIAESLRLAPQPDFSRYSGELETFRESAQQLIAESKKATEAIVASDLDSDSKALAVLAHQQVFYDSGWVICFCWYVKAMREGNRQSQTYFREMADYSHKAHANLAASQQAMKRFNAKYK